MIGYKLTNNNMQTYNGFQWKLGKTNHTIGDGGLCGPGWLHFYRHPLLAVLHNPIHANFNYPRLFECEVGGRQTHDNWMKSGCTRLTLMRELDLPIMSETQQSRYAVGCAASIYSDEKGFIKWVNQWLCGEDQKDISITKLLDGEIGKEVIASAVNRIATKNFPSKKQWIAHVAAVVSSRTWGEINLSIIADWAIGSSTNLTQLLNDLKENRSENQK